MTGQPWFRVPKPHGTSGMPLKIAEMTTSAALDKNTKAFAQLPHSVWHVMPPVEPNILKPAVELYANKDFRGHEIVPHWMQKLPPEQHVRPYTLETSTWLSQFTPFDPISTEHLLTGYSAGMYRGTVGMAESAAGKRTMRPSDLPIIGGFMLNDEIPLKKGAQLRRNTRR